MQKERYSIEKLEKASKILKTIAHPVKLEILQVLGLNEEVDVSSICESLGNECQISMLSQHLSKLKDNGIVKSRKKGKQVYYSLVDREILSIFDCIDKCKLD